MKHPIVLYIAWRYMCRRKLNYCNLFITWFSIISTTFGVSALIIILSIMNGFENEILKNIFNFVPQVLLTNSEEKLNTHLVPSSMIKKLHGIISVTPLITCSAILQSNTNISLGTVLGIDPNNLESLNFYKSMNINVSQLKESKYFVILGEKLAYQLKVKKGDVLRILVPNSSNFSPFGHIFNQRLFTIIEIYTSDNATDSSKLLISQKNAAKLMHYQNGYITGWCLQMKNPLSVDRISKQILPNGLEWRDWRESKGELFQAIHMEKNLMGLLFGLIIVAASLNIATSLNLFIIEKKAEIAILQTQGLSYNKIVLIFITYGASSGILGSLFGTVLGIFLTSNLKKFTSIINIILDQVFIPVKFNISQIIIILLLTITISILSTLYPSLSIIKKNTAKVLCDE